MRLSSLWLHALENYRSDAQNPAPPHGEIIYSFLARNQLPSNRIGSVEISLYVKERISWIGGDELGLYPSRFYVYGSWYSSIIVKLSYL